MSFFIVWYKRMTCLVSNPLVGKMRLSFVVFSVIAILPSYKDIFESNGSFSYKKVRIFLVSQD